MGGIALPWPLRALNADSGGRRRRPEAASCRVDGERSALVNVRQLVRLGGRALSPEVLTQRRKVATQLRAQSGAPAGGKADPKPCYLSAVSAAKAVIMGPRLKLHRETLERGKELGGKAGPAPHCRTSLRLPTNSALLGLELPPPYRGRHISHGRRAPAEGRGGTKECVRRWQSRSDHAEGPRLCLALQRPHGSDEMTMMMTSAAALASVRRPN